MTQKEQPARNWTAGITNITEVIAIGGVILYLIGWNYLYGYHRGFGLTPAEITIPVQTVLIYSIPVVSNYCFGAVFILSLIGFVIIRAKVSSRVAVPLLILLLPIAGIIASVSANSIGRKNAIRDIFVESSVLPNVSIQMIEGVRESNCEVSDLRYKLLLRSNNFVYVFAPVSADGQPLSGNFRVCAVPESQIRSIRFQVPIEGGQR